MSNEERAMEAANVVMGGTSLELWYLEGFIEGFVEEYNKKVPLSYRISVTGMLDLIKSKSN
ncbi:MAG: hypothetical protein PHY47_00560 [Lachnospiraceae bacterium]|nr:hypothetical protein [Lachnospiraceae bacterium]